MEWVILHPFYVSFHLIGWLYIFWDNGLTQGLILEEDYSIIEDGKYEVPIILF